MNTENDAVTKLIDLLRNPPDIDDSDPEELRAHIKEFADGLERALRMMTPTVMLDAIEAELAQHGLGIVIVDHERAAAAYAALGSKVTP